MKSKSQQNSFDEQFAKLVKYMAKRFDDLEAKIDTKADAGRVYTTLDGIAKRLDIDDSERTAMVSQLDRHEVWVNQAAKQLKIKYQA